MKYKTLQPGLTIHGTPIEIIWKGKLEYCNIFYFTSCRTNPNQLNTVPNTHHPWSFSIRSIWEPSCRSTRNTQHSSATNSALFCCRIICFTKSFSTWSDWNIKIIRHYKTYDAIFNSTACPTVSEYGLFSPMNLFRICPVIEILIDPQFSIDIMNMKHKELFWNNIFLNCLCWCFLGNIDTNRL